MIEPYNDTQQTTRGQRLKPIQLQSSWVSIEQTT